MMSSFQKASLNDMMEYFMQGDKHTEECFLRYSRYLGIGLSNLVNVFNPEIVILNGPFIYEIQDYYTQVVGHTKKNMQKDRDITFTQGVFKENAAAVGAAILLFDSYFL